MSWPRASILAVVQIFRVFTVGGGVSLAFTRTIDVAGTTEDFMKDALHQKGISDLLMPVIRIQKFLVVSQVVKWWNYNLESDSIDLELEVAPVLVVFVDDEIAFLDEFREAWDVFLGGPD